MKILFIGGYYPLGAENALLKDCKYGELSIPSNVYQWGVIDGLLSNSVQLSLLSCPFLPAFPVGYKHLFTPQIDFIIDGRNVGVMKRFCDLALVKPISRRRAFIKGIIQWIASEKIEKNERFAILSYSPSGDQIVPMVKLKKKYPNLITCCIITDLFQKTFADTAKMPIFRRLQMCFEIYGLEKALSLIDKFVLLAKGMEELVPETVNKNIIIEGIASEKPFYKKSDEESRIKTLLYTGSLGEHTSVKELIDAFMLTQSENYRLCICGGGIYSDYIEECTKKDKRIEYLGVVPREQSIKLQQNATVLINPRFPSIRDTPYSFPSKTMEYLTSGSPMIGFKLKGIPSEYYDYFYTVQEESIESLSNTIDQVLSLSQIELNRKALSAYCFIENYKIAKAQMSKLLYFLNE